MIDDPEEMATSLVDEYLGDRLDFAGNPPGLRDAAIALLAGTVEKCDFELLLQQQLDQLRHPSSNAVPDAYLIGEIAAEDALQRAAAGIRQALEQSSHVVDARAFERDAARRLGDDARLAIRAELARVPRPVTRPQVLHWSINPAPWAAETHSDAFWPPPGLDESIIGLRSVPGGSAALARVDGGTHDGWVQIAMIERQRTPPVRYPKRPPRSIFLAVGMETVDGERPDKSLPFNTMPWQSWIVPWQRIDTTTNPLAAGSLLADTSDWPAVAVAQDSPWITGVGEPPFVLVPVLPLVVALELEPTPGALGFSLSDRHGPGLVSRLWRGQLVHDGAYTPQFPAVHGVDLLLRSDLFDRLSTIAGEGRLRGGLCVRCSAGQGSAEAS